MLDNLPDFFREGIDSQEEEGVGLYYKPGEREKYDFPKPVMIAQASPPESTKEQTEINQAEKQ